ncbi:MAG: ATP-grasp domain-containing protein [Flavobacteriales bacterium]
MGKTNILITSAGRRVSLVRAFMTEAAKFENIHKVFCTDMYPELSSACQVANHSFKVDRVTSPTYIADLLTICIKNEVRLIIPTIDTELLILANHVDEFGSHGISILLSDKNIIEYCRDKRALHEYFDALNITRVKEYDKHQIQYPCFVKPIDGSRSVGTYKLNSKEELTDDIFDNPKNMFLEYIAPEQFNEFTVDIYFNKHSKICSIVPRERIFVRDGEVNKACTRKNGIIQFLLSKFDNQKGLRGCITFQVFKQKNIDQFYAIEINPRFGGGFPLSYLAGANFPKWIIQEYLYDTILKEYSESWRDNTLMLRYDHEIIVNEYKN